MKFTALHLTDAASAASAAGGQGLPPGCGGAEPPAPAPAPRAATAAAVGAAP